MKSVLVHIQDDDSLEARLQAGLAVARASRGHLSCLHITPINAFVAYEQFGGVFVMNDVMTALQKREDNLQASTEEHLVNEDVPWDYTKVTGDPTRILVGSAALYDLLVVSRSEHRGTSADPAMALFGDLLQSSRTPILVQPVNQSKYDPLGPVAVAWNGSFESSNALRQAIPFLSMASDVHLISIDEGKVDQLPSLAASEYLARHGVTSQMHEIAPGTDSIAQTLVSAATSLDASTLVMGAYGHSRTREYFFGGVTRSLLLDCPLPLLLAR